MPPKRPRNPQAGENAFGRLFGAEGIFQNPPQPETGLRPNDPGAFEAAMAGPGGFMGGGALGSIRSVLPGMFGNQISVFRNITKTMAKNLLDRTKSKELRSITDPVSGQTYVWDASKGLHEEVAVQLFNRETRRTLIRKNIKNVGQIDLDIDNIFRGK